MDKQMSLSGLVDELSQARTKKKELLEPVFTTVERRPDGLSPSYRVDFLDKAQVYIVK